MPRSVGWSTGKSRPKPIVVGTDGTPSSYVAVETAARIAVDDGCELIVVSAYEPASAAECARHSLELGDLSYQMVGSSPAEGTAREAMCYANRVGASAQCVARRGLPAAVLRQVAKEVDACLIVVGKSRARGLTGLLSPSTPTCLQQKAPCKVMVVDCRGKKPTPLSATTESRGGGDARGRSGSAIGRSQQQRSATI
jgi:nucleotide-binding universal stress UspA family protein